jgi:hypothetical protein
MREMLSNRRQNQLPCRGLREAPPTSEQPQNQVFVATLPVSVWLAFKRLTTLGFPRRFPVVQFPNVPLIVAFLAAEAATFLHGDAHFYARSASYLGMTIWAYEELVHGVNWFRHLLGLAYTAIMVMRVAHALHA